VALAELVGVAPSSHKGTVLHKYVAVSKLAHSYREAGVDPERTSKCLQLIQQASGSMMATRNSVGAHPLHYAIESKHTVVANALIRAAAGAQRHSDSEYLSLARRESHARGKAWLNPGTIAPVPSERPLQLSTGSMSEG